MIPEELTYEVPRFTHYEMLPGTKSKLSDTVERSALKALVTLFGPREAARQVGMNEGTVCKLASKHKWKKAVPKSHMKDAGDVIRDAIENSKHLSTVHLAKYTERASMAAADHSEPLDVAKQVSHVASVYKTLWPQEKQAAMIDGAILIGGAIVTEAKQVQGEVIDASDDIVREELPDRGPQGH